MTRVAALGIAMVCGLACGLLGPMVAQAQDANGPPNIVLVFIDDMGWGDLSCFGNTKASTPEIDRLAREGIRFEQFYVNSPICSPSRVAISTGQYPQRWKISSYLARRALNRERGMADWLDPQAPMLARSLQQVGYATGHFGKWHLGGQRDVDNAPPIVEYGFDESVTNFEGMGPKLLPLTQTPGVDKPGRIWADAERLGPGAKWVPRSRITEAYVADAAAFIRAAAARRQPFYVNVWPDDVHAPYWPPLDRWSEQPAERYRAVLETMDRQLGPLFQLIRDDPELNERTLILVCSDNGPPRHVGTAGPWRGYKTQLYEGGIRSPLVVWGPGFVQGQARVDRESVFSAIDLVPSLLEFAGVEPPPGASFDGESLPGTLMGTGGSRSSPLMFRRPPDRDAFYGDEDLPDLAMRSGDWKFLCEFDGSEPELYLLSKDPGEKDNLAAARPDRVRVFRQQLIRWHNSLPADGGSRPPRQPDPGDN